MIFIYATQMDLNSISGWRTANLMKLNVNKIRVIYCSRKYHTITFENKISKSPVYLTHTIKDLGTVFHLKLYFYHYMNKIFYCSLKLLSLNCVITFFFIF
jgi:hypothetical protein